MRREGKLTKSGILSTDTDNQHIKRDNSMRHITFNLRVITDINQTLLVVDLGGFSFVVFDGRLLVAEDVANGFHNRAMFNQTGCAGREQGRKQEEVARRDDDDIVVFSVEFFEETDRAPTAAYMPLIRAMKLGVRRE